MVSQAEVGVQGDKDFGSILDRNTSKAFDDCPLQSAYNFFLVEVDLSLSCRVVKEVESRTNQICDIECFLGVRKVDYYGRNVKSSPY